MATNFVAGEDVDKKYDGLNKTGRRKENDMAEMPKRYDVDGDGEFYEDSDGEIMKSSEVLSYLSQLEIEHKAEIDNLNDRCKGLESDLWQARKLFSSVRREERERCAKNCDCQADVELNADDSAAAVWKAHPYQKMAKIIRNLQVDP